MNLLTTPQQGYDDYGKNAPPQHPDNAEYMSGWVAGWGVTDAYCGEPALFPQDEYYMKGFNIVGETMTKAGIDFM